MPLPTPEKSYQFAHQVNTIGSTVTDSYKKALLSLVQAMLSFPSNPWVCVASSNGVVANSSMNWNTTADLVCSTSGPCSWILLSQPGIAANYQLLLAYRAISNTDGREMRTSASHVGGFAPLNSVSTVPTTTNEYAVISSTTYWFDDFSAAFASVCEVMMAEDGSATHWVLNSGGHSHAWHMFAKMPDPVTGITDPSIMVRIGGAPPASSVLLSTYFTGFHNFVAGMQAGTVSRFFLGSEAYNTTLLGRQNTRKNAVSGEYVMAPIGAICDTNSIEGRHCHLPDVWFGPTDVLVPDGSYYPADGSRQFIQFGDVVFKWDGTLASGMSGNDVDGYLCGFGAPPCDCPEPPPPAPPPVSTIQYERAGVSGLDDTSLGLDVLTFPAPDPTFTLYGGGRIVGERCARRLTTRRSSMPFHEDDGLDILEFLNESMSEDTLFRIKAFVENECLKDEEVQACECVASFDTLTQTLVLVVVLTLATGPFKFVLKVADLTPEVIFGESA